MGALRLPTVPRPPPRDAAVLAPAGLVRGRQRALEAGAARMVRADSQQHSGGVLALPCHAPVLMHPL
eukprot:6201081-Pleurochrysis_carterae.AAC.1